MKEYTCQILWSTRSTPEHIKKMLSSERIQELLKCKKLPLALYPFDALQAEEDHHIIRLDRPFGWIDKIYIDEQQRYVAHFNVLDRYTPNYDCIFDPVIHPMCLGNPLIPDTFSIMNFYVWEVSQLNLDNLYDGIHYPTIPSIGSEIHIPNLQLANREARERLNAPFVKWDDINSNDAPSIIGDES